MPEQFKTGDVVQLKSGGPVMTAERVEQAPQGQLVTCRWFNDDTHKFEGTSLSSDLLYRVEH